ncbi:MAG: 23S rRNA (adenine(2503)-C(2))-methyltransferase RlmN [Spirochaetales bacterium]|jgi:23S rRNA (adenine2503-C2)-methyltransferase|nr:23S rRNA (adenine(2503)-C(2))-methyltransferase RlmN [Spirochaetales bacterium]
MRLSLYASLPEEIAARLGLEKAYRGRQIFEGLHKRGLDFASMTDLPASLRDRLAAEIPQFTTKVVQTLRDPDGTVKLRIAAAEDEENPVFIECVLLETATGRKTACLSTQAGCAMGCAFCKTGTLGLLRNLEAAEIMEQFHHLARGCGAISNIVFMGMGEPLENLAALRKAIAVFTHPGGLALSPRRLTVSTCGVVPGILSLADEGPFVSIAVSLVSADEEKRKTLMPAAGKWGLEELKKALLYHQEKTGKRLTVEIVVLKGINDGREDIRKLRGYLDGLDAIVNLIPWNPAPGLNFQEAPEAAIQLYYTELEGAGIPAVRRYRRGRKIGGACGQLGGGWEPPI